MGSHPEDNKLHGPSGMPEAEAPSGSVGIAVTRQSPAMARRSLLKLMGLGTLDGVNSLATLSANAATWQRVGGTVVVPAKKIRPPQRNRPGLRGSMLACSYGHSLMLRPDGQVLACGYNDYGNIGDNSLDSRSTYVQAIGFGSDVAVACGYCQSLAIRSDGTVFSCGYNSLGQIGDNTATDRSGLVYALGISNAVAGAAGRKHSIVLRSDGLVFASGENTYAHLGDNTTTGRSTFVQAIGANDVVVLQLAVATVSCFGQMVESLLVA